MRGRASTLLSVVLTAGGCTCGSRGGSTGDSSAPNTTPEATAAAATATGDAVFSAPIAGARFGGGDVVAGLVASAGLIRVMARSGDSTSWTTEPLRDVAWAPDAELRVQAAHDGLALVWRGLHAGKSGRTLVLLSPRGEPLGSPVDIGSSFCATEAGVAWLEPRAAGPTRVMAHAWSEAAPRAVTTVAADRDAALVCGDRDVVVLGDGDDDLTIRGLTPGEATARAATVAIRDSDFGEDEEREHDAYTVGDDLGLARIGSSGAIALREVPRSGVPTPWRRLRHGVPADDDIVAVDGDALSTLIVFTHDSDAPCPGVGATAEAVRALRVVRATGEETLVDLAPADCARAPGPFWIGAVPAGTLVGWVERRATAAPGEAPVVGASIHLLLPSGTVDRRLEQPADAASDLGCDARGCSLAILLRPPGVDATQAEAIRVLPYP